MDETYGCGNHTLTNGRHGLSFFKGPDSKSPEELQAKRQATNFSHYNRCPCLVSLSISRLLIPSTEGNDESLFTNKPLISSNELSKRTAGLAIVCIFTISVLALAVVFANFPEMNELEETLECEQNDMLSCL